MNTILVQPFPLTHHGKCTRKAIWNSEKYLEVGTALLVNNICLDPKKYLCVTIKPDNIGVFCVERWEKKQTC